MSDSIWTSCNGKAHIISMTDDFVRIVESQQQIATTHIVDSLEEQAVLEELLETTKPPITQDSRHLHFLLATPFRYPPLKHGSRFGQRHERSLFYGSKKLETVLAESSYYRFVFWHGMRTAPKSAQFITEHTVFGARYFTKKGLRLQLEPFKKFTDDLANPASYQVTQQLGSEMRDAGVEAIEYISARAAGVQCNIALFTPAALSVNEPLYANQWVCATTKDKVSYTSREVKRVFSFALEEFYVEGSLPAPAM